MDSAKEGQKKEGGSDPATKGAATPAAVETIAGGFAGCMSVVLGHPFDLIRTHQQSQFIPHLHSRSTGRSIMGIELCR